MTDLNADPNAAEAAAEDDAAAIWAEFDAADGTPSGDQANGDSGNAEDFPAEDDGTGATAPEAGTEPSAEAGAEPALVTPEAPADDRWAALPDDARAELARLTAENATLSQKERSASGRAGAFQRKYEDLVKAAQPREARGDRPTPDAALAAIAEDYPEIAKPLTEALKAVQGDVDTLAQAEEGRRQAAEAELGSFLDEQEQSLRAAHPDYAEVLKANGPKFAAWVEDQPKAIREAAFANANTITDAASAATVIGAFKAFLTPPAAAPAAQTAQLSERRQRQLGSSSSPSLANRRPSASGIPENGDPQAIWDAFDQIEAKAKR